MPERIEHVMFIGPPCFPVFNVGLRKLSMEPVQDDDVVPFQRSDNADMRLAASASWSSDCEWYFIVLPDGIALFNVYNRTGLFCQRHTAQFFERCMCSGILSKPAIRPSKRSTPPTQNGKTG